MLATKFRFHGYGSLRFLFSHGKTHRSKSMSIRVAPNPRRQNSRVSVVISKKVIKASPKRNRVRRRVYEVLRTEWQHIKPSQDILLSVYDPEFFDAEHAVISEEIKKLLKTAQVWVD